MTTTEATAMRDALQGLYWFCLHHVPNVSEFGDGAKEMRAARLALGIAMPVPLEPIICDDCKKEVDEIHRTRTDGVRQCYDCYIGEEGPQT